MLETRLEINALGVIAFRQLTWMMVVRKEVAEVSSIRTERKRAMSFAAMIVHVDVERDFEQRVQLALTLADRFRATLIGVAGMALRPAFAAGGIVVYAEPSQRDREKVTARLEEMGKKFRAQGQGLEQIEWRTAFEIPSELVAREARAADLVIVGPRHAGDNVHDLADPGAILLRAGRPVLVVPDVIAPRQLHRAVVAWKDTRECRRAVRDALPFLQQAKEVLLIEIGEDEAEARARKSLADVANYLVRHRVIVAAEAGGGPEDRPPPSSFSLSRTRRPI